MYYLYKKMYSLRNITIFGVLQFPKGRWKIKLDSFPCALCLVLFFCFTDAHTAPSSARSPPPFQITANAVPESRKQHKHVRARQALSSNSRSSPTVTSDESSSQATAIWFPWSSRPTSQRNATESTGTHCRASLYRDVSGAGKPAPAPPRSAEAVKLRPRLFGFGLREGLDADLFFCLSTKEPRLSATVLCVTSVDESFFHPNLYWNFFVSIALTFMLWLWCSRHLHVNCLFVIKPVLTRVMLAAANG